MSKQTKQDSALTPVTVQMPLAASMIGKKVLVRSRMEGVNAGIVKLADETGVVITEARRLWKHRPKDSSLSWYEGVAVSGLHKDSIVSGTVPEKVIIENYSMTLCSDEAFTSIMEQKPNES